jgi:hypothetical protein
MPAVRLNVAQERGASEASRRTRLPGLQQSLPDRRNHASRDAQPRRVWAEFEEMQGLKLTFAQATRLFALREDVCLRVPNSLIRDGLLQVTPERLFARRRIDV